MSIRISTGLRQSFANFKVLTVDETITALKTRTNIYEVLNEDFNRIYGDVDGRILESTTKEEFDILNEKTRKEIIDFLKDEPYALYTASSFDFKKISFGFVLKNKKISKVDNKRFIELISKEINFPEGIALDTGVYGKNQKIRCLGSSKDGEARPKILLHGDPIDTLISYTEGCELKELPPPIKKKKVVQQDVIAENILEKIVMNITNDCDWDKWYRVAQAIFNEKGSEELFLKWSRTSPKHNERQAIAQWKSLKLSEDNKLTSASLWYWSSLNKESHEQIILEHCSPDEYQHQKIMFEKEHFKLKNPPCYVRQYNGQIQYLKENDLHLMYANKFCASELFIQKWKADQSIRTYEEIVFKPKQVVAPEYFNIFTDFSCKAVEGNIDVMKDLFWLLSGESKEVQEYLESFFAHLIQKPYEKPGVAIVFYTSKQGAGKDTPLDFIGKMIGSEYFFNTEDAENNVFGRFTSHLQKTLLLKMEEVEFEINKKNESALLSLITAETRSFEGKGREPVTLDDYKRIVMTTNKSTPVNIPESDRRFVLINSSERRVGDREYWNKVYKELAKPETAQAFMYYLLNKDISNFDIRDRLITEFYKDVKTTLKPYHASYFQKWIAEHGEHTESSENSASEWVSQINIGLKFSVTTTKFGRDAKIYPSEVLTKKKGMYSNSYILHTKEMHEFLKNKGWWDDV
jgi:hypothetical protein